jgi:YD repeat-containing protein
VYGTGSQLDRWTRVVHGSLRDSLAFDLAGRTQVYRYHKNGQRDSLWVSGPTGVGPWSTKWRYNALAQLDTIIDRAGLETRLVYDDDGIPIERHLSNTDVLRNT